MITVEQKKRPPEAAPLVYWADEITVSEAEGALNLLGAKGIPPSVKERDLMSGHLDALANANPKAGEENTSPHIVFVNCGGDAVDDQEGLIRKDCAWQSKEERSKAQTALNTLIRAWDSALKKYVTRYGPVLAEPASVQVRAVPGGAKPNSRWVEVQAQQRWDVLKREARTLSAVMRVFEQTRSETPSHDVLFRAAGTVVLGTAHWVDACKLESAALRPGRERPSWTWTGADQFRAQALASALGPVDTRVRFTCPNCGEVHQIETFWPVSQLLQCKCGCQSDLLRASSDGKLRENDCPDWAIAKGRALLCHILNAFPGKLTDYNGIPFEMPSEDVSAGILPALYQLIRWDYLRDAKIASCAWRDCTKWFRVGRHKSPCCSPEHSLKYRQSEYYRLKGKELRRKRTKFVGAPKYRPHEKKKRN
jgi:predicted RNA-binding Zn-ribbon protein involved in translation (DUF1610 family)